MFSELLHTSIVNLVPFWTIDLLKYLNIGNEYNALISLIFNQIVSYITKIDEKICVAIIVVIITIIICYRLNFFSKISLFNKNKYVMRGIELNNSDNIECIYSDSILALNDYLINTKKIKNIVIFNNIETLGNMDNFNITDDIYLSVSRLNGGNNSNSMNIDFTLSSYRSNIREFLDSLLKEYHNKNYSEIILIGKEEHKILNYPEHILAINYYVLKIKNFNFPKLLCMNTYKFNTISNGDNKQNSNNNSNSSNSNNNKNNDAKNKDDDKNQKNECLFSLNNVNAFKIDDNIELSISRNNNLVYYTLRSKTTQCKEWLEEIIKIYDENKNCKFKNKLIIHGSETTCYSGKKTVCYSNLMLALNWHVIEKLKFQNYEYVEDDNLIYNYILDSISLLKLDEDLYLEVDKEISKKWYDSERKNNNSYNTKYTVHSDTKDIKQCINKYLDDFNKIKSGSNKIYYFTYAGLKENIPSFNTHLLSEKDTINELYETFDKIQNEHTQMFKDDVDKLKDIEYYKKHGLKRKKGYLFHGEPGCGKTSSVVAMALYDNRHIIEIPFELLKSNDEFEQIMNLTMINNISINNNNIILLFDEINYGFKKIISNNEIKTEAKTDGVSGENLVKILSGDTVEQQKPPLSVGTILSKLDGISNYNGLIIVATTNHIDKLEPALYREMRLTAIEFKKLRIIDCINIIQSYFEDIDNEQLNNIIKDRAITPAKLIWLCSTYDYKKSDVFINDILTNTFNNI
jgi:hypothetical protein